MLAMNRSSAIPKKRAELLERYGEDADFLVVEALVETGVLLSPLSKYRDFNIRVCRPYNLSGAICMRSSMRQCATSATFTTSKT